MANYVSVTSDKKKHTALLMCIFGGWFGLHQFYVGRIGMGLLYLFTGGLFFKCYWWDVWKIALGKFTDNTGTYLRE
jgi:TM2 domain-containing membrane protein YozV